MAGLNPDMTTPPMEKLERLVLERKKTEARALARRLLKKYPDSIVVFNACCESYRRLGLYRDGLKAIGLETIVLSSHQDRAHQRQRRFWAMRFLNLVGASEFALQLVAYVTPQSSLEHRYLGEVLLANFDHHRALVHFEEMVRLETDSQAYSSRIARLSLSDALVGLGKYDEAIQIVEDIMKHSNEPLIVAIALQAKGEYLARAGRYHKALPLLEKAITLFDPNDETTDHALALKWYGYVIAKLGNKIEGPELMDRSFALLRKLKLREEAWLDVVRLKVDAGVASSEELGILASFPGLPDGFRQMIPEPPAKRLRIPKNKIVIDIDLRSDEFTHSAARRLGIPLEIKLLALVRLASPMGIRIMKTLTLLWPGEVHSFMQLENRLYKLTSRLKREYEVTVNVLNGELFLSDKDEKRIRVHSGPARLPSFLLTRKMFKTSDLCGYYDLKNSQGSKVILRWLEIGLIEKVRDGRLISYRAIEETGLHRTAAWTD